jgi:soluble lytic murein transglycosylase-like protein
MMLPAYHRRPLAGIPTAAAFLAAPFPDVEVLLPVALSRGMGAATPGASDLVTQTALRYGVDPALALAVAQQESGLNQSARSSAGAIGIMQLMPGTARDLGVDPYDLAQNVDGGVRYLRQQLDRFGDPSLALAAYNAGPGAVQRYGGIPPYPETQNYVARILGSWDASEELGAPLPLGGSEETILEAGAGESETESEPSDSTGLLLAAGAAVAALALLT